MDDEDDVDWAAVCDSAIANRSAESAPATVDDDDDDALLLAAAEQAEQAKAVPPAAEEEDDDADLVDEALMARLEAEAAARRAAEMSEAAPAEAT